MTDLTDWAEPRVAGRGPAALLARPDDGDDAARWTASTTTCAASADLSLTEYEILVRLSERDGRQMRMAQLADALAHSRSRVTHTVARMERAGLVKRGSVARGRPRRGRDA